MKVLLSNTGYWRKPNLRIRTDVIEDNKLIYVKKIALGSESKKILQNTLRLYPRLKSMFPSKVGLAKPIKQVQNEFIFEFATGSTLEKLIEQALIERDFKKAKDLFYEGCRIIDSLPSKKSALKNEKGFIKFFSLDRRYHSMELQFISPALLELTA